MDHELCCSTSASGEGYPDTLSWMQNWVLGGIGSSQQEDMSVEVTECSWGQSWRMMPPNYQPLGNFFQGTFSSGQLEVSM